MPWYYIDASIAISLSWIAFCLTWFIWAFTAKRARYRQPLRQRLVYFAWGALCSILIQNVRVLHEPIIPIVPVTSFIGAASCILGLAFAVWARAHLGSNWSGFVQIKENHELIQTGPYRLVRHPIYTGILLAIAGSLLALLPSPGSILALLVLTFAFVVKLRQEEKLMLQEFSEQYPAYKSRVKARLIPYLI